MYSCSNEVSHIVAYNACIWYDLLLFYILNFFLADYPCYCMLKVINFYSQLPLSNSTLDNEKFKVTRLSTKQIHNSKTTWQNKIIPIKALANKSIIH